MKNRLNQLLMAHSMCSKHVSEVNVKKVVFIEPKEALSATSQKLQNLGSSYRPLEETLVDSVRCFVWRARLDRFSAKSALIARGAGINGGGFSMCIEADETPSHLLVSCPFASRVWEQVAAWCGVSLVGINEIVLLYKINLFLISSQFFFGKLL
ncbi:hypothetical protein QVD17_32286 [Tagetes erecta]|uniref:Reverse transcriptase zinc-binding domain-containing protein n=1 Tax=Tagetes erecta TaxID=13708 RepID=A0AAD8K4Y4_TARER|nr:hypothetical protein QVD17_32286 [Tagetes erecta]